MKQMFHFCSNLESLDVSHFDTSNVTTINAMFRNCVNIKYFDISSFDTSNVTNMSYLFFNCSSLKCIFASDKFTTAKITSANDGADMFTGDDDLVGYDKNPAENQHSHKDYDYQNEYQYAQIYKVTDITQGIYGQVGFFTDVANKEAVLSYLSSL